MRTKGDLEAQTAKTAIDSGQAAGSGRGEGAERRSAGRLRGDRADHAEFHKVETGITGATDIEVLSGLEAGDQIITGSYKVIRSMRNDARVKVDNRTAARWRTRKS